MKPTGTIHAAKFEKSPRLRAVYFCLCRGPKTTKEIILETGYCAINSVVAELRKNGIRIECECLSPGIYQYKLEGLFG